MDSRIIGAVPGAHKYISWMYLLVIVSIQSGNSLDYHLQIAYTIFNQL